MDSAWQVILWYPASAIPAGVTRLGVRTADWRCINLRPGETGLLVPDIPWR